METQHGHLMPLSDSEIEEILDRGMTAHLGCFNRGEIYIVPVTYVKDGNYLYSHSRPGKKIDMMRANPIVCLQVEEINSMFDWKSVVVQAFYEELDEFEASAGMRLLIKRIAEYKKTEIPSSLEMDIAAMLNNAIIYRFRITEISGRTEGQEA